MTERPERPEPDRDPPRLLRATCAPGLSPWLEREIRALGHEPVNTEHTGVEIKATMVDSMRLALRLRTGFHLLQRFADLNARTADQMYEQAVRLPWERVLGPDGYLSVVSSVRNESIRNSMFANVRLKDAIVDRISHVEGRRPDAGPKNDQAVVHLFWHNDHCRVSLDLAGRKLSDRGYRKIPHLAPMRETIAAAILIETGYDGSRPLLVPMCGSGTIAIEAALMAAGRAPGLLRNNFGLQHLRTFDPDAWQSERNAARKLRNKKPIAPIVATDIDPGAVEAAHKNAVTAGVDHLIRFEVGDFATIPIPSESGTVILHGEYGERMGNPAEVRDTYRRIGDFLKQACAGWNAYVFTSREMAGEIGLKAAQRTPFENGGIDCRLLRFELYAGSRTGE